MDDDEVLQLQQGDSTEPELNNPDNAPPPCMNQAENPPEPAHGEEEENIEKPRPKQKKIASKVWDHFTKEIVVVNANGEKEIAIKAKYNYCKVRLGAESRNRTTHLKNHFMRCIYKKNVKIDVNQQLLNSSNAKFNGSITLENFKFNQETSRRELGNMVVLHEYPLSIVDHLGFKKFVSSFNPLFKMISRNTLKSDLLKNFEYEKESLKKYLENLESRVAITTDMWTASNQRKGYMAITGHFIDGNWILRSRILRYNS
ncbi:hypothetical protein Dimus_037959 [Dionaea muscipula]